MAAVPSQPHHPSPSTGINAAPALSTHHLSRSIERALDEATYTGELILTGRKLREFPNFSHINNKCDLSDTITAGEFADLRSMNAHRLSRSFSQPLRGISTHPLLVLLSRTTQSAQQCPQIHS